MSAVIAPSSATAPRRMSLWTAFWSLAGGGIVGGIAATPFESALRQALRLDPGGRYAAVWTPFVPIDDWARAADLATLAVVVLACALCARRISRDEMLELPLPAAAAAVTGIGAVAYLTHSWWSLLAILPVAFVARYAARPPAVRSRRRILVAGLGAVAYLAFVGAAFADLQSHPLDVSPSTSCGGRPGILQALNSQPGAPGPLMYADRPGGTALVCLAVRNNAWSRSATILGVASAALPKAAPWTIAIPPVPIRAGHQREVLVAIHMNGCAGRTEGRSAELRSIPLRVRVGGATTTEQVALRRPIAASCAAG